MNLTELMTAPPPARPARDSGSQTTRDGEVTADAGDQTGSFGALVKNAEPKTAKAAQGEDAPPAGGTGTAASAAPPSDEGAADGVPPEAANGEGASADVTTGAATLGGNPLIVTSNAPEEAAVTRAQVAVLNAATAVDAKRGAQSTGPNPAPNPSSAQPVAQPTQIVAATIEQQSAPNHTVANVAGVSSESAGNPVPNANVAVTAASATTAQPTARSGADPATNAALPTPSTTETQQSPRAADAPVRSAEPSLPAPARDAAPIAPATGSAAAPTPVVPPSAQEQSNLAQANINPATTARSDTRPAIDTRAATPEGAVPRDGVPLPDPAEEFPRLQTPAPGPRTAEDHTGQFLAARAATGDAQAAANVYASPTAQATPTGPATAAAPLIPLGVERTVLPQIVSAMPTNRAPGVIEINLDPPELGRLDIVIEVSDQNLRATLSAERQFTGDLIRRHSEQLLDQFREAGFDSIDLNFGEAHDDANLAGEGGAEAAPAFTDRPGPALADAPTRRAIPAAGGMDIRL
ncbi:MAG: flagellar hook-length control protein FliK [Pseudomonadota bacterium]